MTNIQTTVAKRLNNALAQLQGNLSPAQRHQADRECCHAVIDYCRHGFIDNLDRLSTSYKALTDEKARHLVIRTMLREARKLPADRAIMLLANMAADVPEITPDGANKKLWKPYAHAVSYHADRLARTDRDFGPERIAGATSRTFDRANKRMRRLWALAVLHAAQINPDRKLLAPLREEWVQKAQSARPQSLRNLAKFVL